MNERPAGQLAYPGMAKFKDLNDDGIINDDDVDVIGDMTPVHTGGFNINATYKNFDLGLYFNWSYGNEIYNVNKLAALYGYKEGAVYENKLSIVKDCYKIYDVVNGELVALTTPEQLPFLSRKAFDEALHLRSIVIYGGRPYTEIGYSIGFSDMARIGVFAGFDCLKFHSVGVSLSLPLSLFADK